MTIANCGAANESLENCEVGMLLLPIRYGNSIILLKSVIKNCSVILNCF